MYYSVILSVVAWGALFQNGTCIENADHCVLYGAALDNVAQIKKKKKGK